MDLSMSAGQLLLEEQAGRNPAAPEAVMVRLHPDPPKGLVIGVCGCGPSLSRHHIPKNSLIIGSNRSWLRVPPHMIATADVDAYRYLNLSGPGCPVRYINDEPKGLVPGWVSMSGTYAIWLASTLKPSELHLTGFGGRGHFDDPPEEKREDLLRRVELRRDMVLKRNVEKVHDHLLDKVLDEEVKCPVWMDGEPI